MTLLYPTVDKVLITGSGFSIIRIVSCQKELHIFLQLYILYHFVTLLSNTRKLKRKVI